MAEILFWTLLFILCYIFCGYPLLCHLLGSLKNRPVKRDLRYTPSVSIIITAYNEEQVISEKLENTLALDYPREKLEIIVASDGSTDRTNEIVRAVSAGGHTLKLLAFSKNRGKTAAQNEAVLNAAGDVIIFSDANAIYHKNAVRKIVRNFYDQTVGCVCGELVYIAGENAAAQGESFYWRYEQFIKKAESKLGNVLGATGAIYAVRRELYVPLGEEIISDFVEPLQIIAQGSRVIYEKEAVACERILTDYDAEMQRKIRIITRGYQGLLSVRQLLNPFKYGFLAVSLLSHRLLRWYAGFFLVLLLLVNICLATGGSKLYVILLICQLLFYGAAAAGILSKTRCKPLAIPAYFCTVNYASMLGVINYYLGRRYVSWKPVR